MRKHLLRILTLVFVVCFGACLFAACGDGEGENPDEQPATYTLTYNANGGTGADVTESHTEGEKVTLKAANTFTYSGHTFKAWNDGTKDYGAGEEFTMPASNVTLKAQWTKNQDTPPAPTTYKVTVTGDHVTATFDAQGPYAEGTTVKFTLAIDSGFELVSVKNGDADVEKGTDNKYFVVVGKADIAITVTTKSMTPTPVAKYTVTVTGNGVTATFDAEGPYEEGTTVKFTLAVEDDDYMVASVKNGDEDVEKGADGKYSVVVGTANISITVTTMEKAKGQLADEANYSVRFGGRQDAIGHENGFLLWWVQGDWGEECGEVVTLTPDADNIASAVENGKLSFQYKGGNRNFSVQLFYYNNHLRAAEYYLTLNIKATVDLSIIVNGEPVELKAGTETPVEVRFTNSLTYEQEIYALDIQFPGTTASTNEKFPNAGVELGDAENVGIEVSDVEWYCVKGTEDETMPYEEAPSYKATDVSLKESDGKVYLVLSGTYKNYDSDEVFRAYLNKFYKDLQVNGFIADGNKWLNQTEWTEFKDLPVKVTAADGEWTYEIEVSSLENHPYQLHFGPIKGDLFIADTSMSGEYLISGDKKFTIHNRLGHGSSEAHEFYGLIGLTIEAYDTETKTVSFRTAEIKADGNTPYLVVYLFTTGYTDAEIKTFKLFDGDKAELTVNESKSTIKANDESILYFDLSAMEKEDGYYGHLKIGDETWTGQENGNIKPVGTVSTEVQIINYRNYNVKYDDYGQLVIVISDVNFLEASLKVEEEKVYYVLKVHFTDKDLDAMKTAVLYDGEKTFNVVQDKVAAIEGTEHDFVLYFDVTAAAKGEFWPHLKFGETPWNGADGNGDVHCAFSKTENTAETDIKTYTLEDGWGMPKLVVSPITTVTFDVDGIEDQKYVGSDKFKAPEDPTMQDHTFLYWYYMNGEDEEKVGEGFIPGDHATENALELKAKWMTHKYPAKADANGNYVCSDCGAILHPGYANATKIGAEVFNEGGEYTSEHGMTVAFWLLSANSDWDSIAIRTVFGGLNVTLPNLQTNVMTDVSSDAALSELKTAFKQTNLFPGDGINQGGSTWDTFKDSNGANSFVTVTLSKTTGVTYYKNGVVQFIYAANLAVGDKTVADFVEAIFLAAKHDGILIGATQFAGTISIEDAMVAPSAMDATAVKALYDSYLAENEFYPADNVAPTHPAYNDLTENAKAAAESNGASTVTFTNQISKGEKIVFEGAHTSTTEFNWDAVQVGLFTGMSGTFRIRADRWVDGTDLTTTDPVHTGVDTQDAQGGTFKEYHWTYTKSNSTYEDWKNTFLPLKQNGYVVITLDWTNEAELAVTLSFSQDAASKADKPIAFTYTISAEEGSALEDSYTFTIIANYCTIDLSATMVPTRTPAAD